MSSSQETSTTAIVNDCLARLRAGDVQARWPLVEAVFRRLRTLAGRMLTQYPKVARFTEADDVAQQVSVRLHKSLEDVLPPTPRDFFRFATVQMRRELVELARKWAGKPQPVGDDSRPPPEESDATHNPEMLRRWTELHEKAGALPEAEREIFELMWYHGLSAVEIAEMLGVSSRTVQRRWASARLLLLEALGGQLPF